MSQFKNIPFGYPIPQNNPHAVSVSLPTIQDIIDYEESKPEALAKMQSGYPRFFRNKFLAKYCNHFSSLNDSNSHELVPISSLKVLNALKKYFNQNDFEIIDLSIPLLKLPINSKTSDQTKLFLRHSGYIPSSRKAEDEILNLGLLNKTFHEERLNSNEAESSIKNTLANEYGSTNCDNVFLAINGMNAIYSVFESLKDIGSNENKNVVVQLGWLYTDTIEIVKKFSDLKHIEIDYSMLDELENYLKQNKNNICALFTELPNNPLLQCFDLPRLSKLCKSLNIPLVIDATFATPFTMETILYADVIVESLTKFACGNADLLMGAIILNMQSEFANKIKEQLTNYLEAPYCKEIQRLAFEIEGYSQRVKKSSYNTKQLAEFLLARKAVKQVNWVYQTSSNDNFTMIQKNSEAFPPLLSVVFNKPLFNYYDLLNFAKGPSLGTEFTLLMPYVYLAHYDMIKTSEGKQHLINIGLHPELLRISVGCEPIEEIIAEFVRILC